MGETTISWTDATWNPVTGCTKVSAGCKHCYAEGVAKRFWGDRKFTDVFTHADRLDQPLHWRKPRRVFVNSMSDLFHDAVPDAFIDDVFRVMRQAAPPSVQLTQDGWVDNPPRHTFQILTKRPERMRDYIRGDVAKRIGSLVWPLPCVWLGVSCEDQRAADERIPLLLQTPAAVRFLSCEPLLGPIQLGVGGEFFDHGLGRGDDNEPRLHWVIAGGESGPGARPCDVAWIRSIVEQCRSAGVACFVKQLGAKPVARDRWDMSEQVFVGYDALGWTEADGPMVMRLRDGKGEDPAEWPEDLRVREFPDERRAQ